MSGRADDIGEPPGDRPSPAPDLQTPSALADSKTLNAPLRKRVETVLQQLKTAGFVVGGMRERVVRSFTHSQDRKPLCSSASGRGPDPDPERSRDLLVPYVFSCLLSTGTKFST
jgi:hypothetical protein